MELLTPEQRALFDEGRSLDDYEVLKPIGKGKFSVVYKAKRLRDEKLVALKKVSIFDMMDAKAREKTLKEVRLAQSVKHPNIIEYLDAFIAENQLYIAFEWAEAGDLKRQIRKANEKNVRFDERTVWRYFSQICSALLYLHEMRIMHRDLKPANIFLTLQGVVKLGDLGLGRHLSEDTMEAHSKVGTPLYMSPEVLRGEGYDWKSDVWSLGCILYELAMLRSPFKSEGLNLYGLFQKINGGQYEPLPVVYTAHLRDLVVKMISLSPENRPTMQEVWEATQARPPSATFRKRQEIVPPSSSVALSNSIPSITQENDPGMRSGSSGKSDELSKTKMPLSNSPAVSLAPSSVSSGGSRGLEPPMVTRIKKVLSHGNQRPISPPDDNNQDTSPCIEAERPSTAPQLAQETSICMIMEVLYEKLKLLRYEKIIKKSITPLYFCQEDCVPGVTPQRRFADMCSIVSWLLGLIDVEIKFEEEDSPLIRAQRLLLAAEKAGFQSNISAPSMTTGCGFAVCTLLNDLVDRALGHGKIKLDRPIYPVDTVETLDTEDDADAIAPENACLDKESDNADDEDPLLGNHALVATEKIIEPTPDLEMIHSIVDPSLWRDEEKKLAPRLQKVYFQCVNEAKYSSSWAMHVESLRTQFELLGNTNTLHSTQNEPKQPQLTGNNNTSSDQLLMLSTSLKAEMNKSLVLENRMNDDYLREGAEYQQFSHQLSVLREKSQSYQNKINTHVIELNQLKEKFSQVAQEISIHNEKISDTQVLHDIKNSLTRIKAEIQQLDCNLEVCRQRWFTLQLKKQDQRRKNGHNKYSKKSFSRHHNPHHHSEDTSDEDEDERSNQSDD